MIRYIFFFLIFLTISSCSGQGEKKIEYYPDGKTKKAEGYLVKGKKEGIWNEYNENGRYTYTYKGGKRQGAAYRYYDAKILSEEFLYASDTLVWYKRFNEDNGKVISEEIHTDSSLIKIAFSLEGVILSKRSYNYSKQLNGWQYDWYENGVIREKSFYLNNQLQGGDSVWYDNATLRSVYDVSKEYPTHIAWYLNGNIEYEGFDIDDSTFYRKAYYRNGIKQDQGKYVNHRENGEWTYWDSLGMKREQGNFVNGKISGHWTYWYSNGQKMKESEFEGEIEIVQNFWNKKGVQTMSSGTGYMIIIESDLSGIPNNLLATKTEFNKGVIMGTYIMHHPDLELYESIYYPY